MPIFSTSRLRQLRRLCHLLSVIYGHLYTHSVDDQMLISAKQGPYTFIPERQRGKYVYFRGTRTKYVYFRGTRAKYVYSIDIGGQIRLFQIYRGANTFIPEIHRGKYVYFRDTRVIFYVRRIGLYLYKYRIYGTKSYTF